MLKKEANQKDDIQKVDGARYNGCGQKNRVNDCENICFMRTLIKI